MKTKSKKFSEAQAARLAAAITSREAEAATHRADLARVIFKKARKAYKAARKAAKRAAKRAKEAQKKFAPLAQHMKPSRPRPVHKARKSRRKPKARPAIPKRRRLVVSMLPAEVISPEAPPTSPADSSPTNSPVV